MKFEDIKKEVKEVVENGLETGTYHWYIDKPEGIEDNYNYAIVMAEMPAEDLGFDSDDLGSYLTAIKFARQPKNSLLQCDYDVDWEMPIYKNQHKVISVYDTETIIDNDVYLDSELDLLIRQIKEYFERWY